ncbi:hypothetical protein [Sediminicola arcticus]|jgi:hypothetical protein|uniref:Outer membrane lipoprotein-sorting protein n=1 Tax=Sediminicola arcticus TaxID=1574308 RepID=A0ABV2SUJ5_9FLAO
MKKLLLFLISTYTFSSCAQEKSIDFVQSALSNLNIKIENCLSEFIIQKDISESETVIVIPEIAHKGDGYMTLNGHLLILNRKNGKIKSRFSEKDSWNSDAIKLENIEVVYQPYQLTKNSETIGVLIEYNGGSRPNPYSSTELSLFIRNGEKLVCVLKDYSIYRLNGETDGMSIGEFVEHRLIIRPNLNSKSEFYDLNIIDSIIKIQSMEGTEKIIEKSKKIENLKYENGKYKNVL